MATKHSIQGSTFLFTGTLTEFTREEAEAMVKDNGGSVLSGVTGKLNYLVVGENAGSKLAKAKALGTVTILTEKEFLSMAKKGKSSGKQDKPSVMKTGGMIQSKNELLIDLKFVDLKKVLKKYVNGAVKEKIIQTTNKINSFDDLSLEDKSFFYYNEVSGKLIMNYLLWDVDGEIELNEALFTELSKHAKADFKLVFLDRSTWELSFCVFTKKKLLFQSDMVTDWEEPYRFDGVPYLVKLAKSNGLKKKKNEDGDTEWDTEEIYNLIYELRDELASGNAYVNLAPDWYKNFKALPN
jgi:hypothetical protein